MATATFGISFKPMRVLVGIRLEWDSNPSDLAPCAVLTGPAEVALQQLVSGGRSLLVTLGWVVV